MESLVTVQIPTYNQKAFIKEALDSALAQTYENLQIIVSDDFSPEYNIFEYLEEYINHPKVLIHRNTHNLGRVGNYRNTLYNLVKGEWFVNLDGDDYFTDNDFIKNAVITFNDFPNANTYQADQNFFKYKNQFPCVEINEDTLLVSSRTFIENWEKVNSFRHFSTLFKTEMAKKSNFYSYNCLFADFNSAAKLWCLSGEIILSSKSVGYWRKHEHNDTFSLNENNYKIEIDSFQDIKRFANDKNIKVDLNDVCKFLKEKIYLDVAYSLTQRKKKKITTFLFLIDNYFLSWKNTKAILRFILNV